MSWSYSGDPAQNIKDEIRFLIKDTDPDRQLVTDEELWYLADKFCEPYRAAGHALLALAAQFSGAVDKSVGDLRLSLGDKAEQFRDMAKEYLRKADITSGAGAYAGGISRTDKRRQELDLDRIETAIARGMHDYPGTGYRARIEYYRGLRAGG